MYCPFKISATNAVCLFIVNKAFIVVSSVLWEHISLSGITFILDFRVDADHFIIRVYISRRGLMCHWALTPRPRQKKGPGDKQKRQMKRAVKGKNPARQSFIRLLTSSLVYQWCVSEKQSRPSAAESSVVSHFCSAAGDQRVGETEGNNRLRGRRRRGESRTEGICWIISLQCCSIDLRMDPRRHRALASRPCRCKGALKVTDLYAALFTDVCVRVVVISIWSLRCVLGTDAFWEYTFFWLGRLMYHRFPNIYPVVL